MVVVSQSDAQLLQELRGLSLARAVKIMNMDVAEDHKDFIKVLSIQQSITTTVIAASVRLGGGELRTPQEDKYEEMLRTARELKAKLKA